MSHFSNAKVTSLNNFCSGCGSLKLLDISGIDLSDATSSISNAFSQLYNLKYLNIKNSTISKELLEQIPKKNLIVCQDGNLIEDDNIINDCCDPNKDLEECHTSNHIIIYYSKECNSNLGNGLDIDPTYDYLDKIKFIYLYNKKYEKTESLELKSNSKLEIYFSSSLSSIDYFCSNEKVNFADNIVSVDLSHLDFRELTSINNLFKGCKTLESVDLSNYNKAKIKGMVSLFDGCEKLKSVDLSGLDTSSVTSISSMFLNCISLEVIYMTGLELSKVDTADKTFFIDTDFDSSKISMKY